MPRANEIFTSALPNFVDDRQKGFIKGRLGSSACSPLRVAAWCLARMGAPSSVIMLLDIEAAFPSASHSLMIQATS